MASYRPRIADRILSDMLRRKGAVLIEGPKWCGKTTTAEQQAASVLKLGYGPQWQQASQLLQINPSQLLGQPAPLLIDEWQTLPPLWDAVRYEVDARNSTGQFVLTGSAVPPQREQIMHSGTGRFAWLRLRPMSLFESGDSSGEIALKALFGAPEQIVGSSAATLSDIAYLMCRGGWPGALNFAREDALATAQDYVDAVVQEDMARVDNTPRLRNSALAAHLLRAYARHQGAQASLNTLAEDMKNHENGAASAPTLTGYLNALRRLFIIEDAPAWNPNLRSKTAVRTSDTRYFADPSIAAAALDLGPQDLMNDLNTMGLLFETLCARDLRCYADALGGHLFHYRDKNGLECDAVIHLRNGHYGLIEVKLGGMPAIDDGAATLKRVASLIDRDKMPAASFLMVLTAVGQFAYRRQDGVYVVPVTCLRD